MKNPKWLRPSALPRLSRCPASGVESEGLPSIGSDAAALGHAFHEIAAAWALGLTMDVEKTARAHGIPLDELEQLSTALHTYTFDGDHVRLAEHPVRTTLADGLEISGTADLVLLHDGWVEIVDVKTGNPDFVTDDLFLQLSAYGIGVADEHGYETARLSLWFARLGHEGWYHRDVVIEEERSRLAEIVGRALSQREVGPENRSYRVGEACTFCPARAICPARMLEMRAFLALENVTPLLLTTENIGRFDLRLRAIDKLVAAAKDARRDFVKEQGGRVELGDGYALVLATEHRQAYTVAEGDREILRRVKS